MEKFKLKSSIIHKWRDIGNLVVPRQQIEVWAKRKDDKECCEAVLSHWLDHPPRHYPATWEGLYELLDDSELGQVAIELKQAVSTRSAIGEVEKFKLKSSIIHKWRDIGTCTLTYNIIMKILC